MTQEKAPDDRCTGRGSMTPKEGTELSSTTMAQSIDLHDSLPLAAVSGGRKPTVGADPRIDVKRAGVVREVVHLRVPNEIEPAEVDWAEARLADREVLVRTRSDHRVSVWQVPSGEWFRAGGHVNFQCGADGVERFTIHLYAGANAADWLFLRRVVDEAKAGIAPISPRVQTH